MKEFQEFLSINIKNGSIDLFFYVIIFTMEDGYMKIVVNLVVMAVTYTIFYGIGYIFGSRYELKKKGRKKDEKGKKMKKEKSSFIKWLIILLAVLIIIIFLWLRFRKQQVYVPDIPNAYNLNSIVWELEGDAKTITAEEKMEDILEGLGAMELETKRSSINDYPSGAKDIITISFNYRDNAVGIFYVYQKNNKYYLEEPYNGIYKLGEDDYKDIKKLLIEGNILD